MSPPPFASASEPSLQSLNEPTDNRRDIGDSHSQIQNLNENEQTLRSNNPINEHTISIENGSIINGHSEYTVKENLNAQTIGSSASLPVPHFTPDLPSHS